MAGGTDAGVQTVKVTFKLPRSFRDELHAAADHTGLSLSDLIRLVLRQWLRGRYDGEQREVLR